MARENPFCTSLITMSYGYMYIFVGNFCLFSQSGHCSIFSQLDSCQMFVHSVGRSLGKLSSFVWLIDPSISSCRSVGQVLVCLSVCLSVYPCDPCVI